MAKRDIMQFQRSRRYAAGVAAVNAADDAAKTKAALVAHGKKLDFDMVAYGKLSADNQGIIDDAVLAEKGTGYASRDALALVFVPALLEQVGIEFALGLINAALSAERMAQLAEKYGDAWGLELDDYNRLSAANKEAVCEEILDGQPYTDVDVVLQAFESAVEDALEEQALEAVNEVSAKEIAAAITLYDDVFELDLGDYNDLDETEKGAVHDALANEVFADLVAFKTAFETAVGEQGGG